MSLFNSFDRTKHLSELNDPLFTQEGVISPENRRNRMAGNMKVPLPVSGSAPASYATAGAQTYTAADVLTGVIVRDCAGAGRSDVLPTAALLVAAIPGAAIGMLVRCLIVNGSDAAETITLGAGTGGSFDTNQTAASRVIPQNTSKLVTIRLTGVASGAEAYVVYA